MSLINFKSRHVGTCILIVQKMKLPLKEELSFYVGVNFQDPAETSKYERKTRKSSGRPKTYFGKSCKIKSKANLINNWKQKHAALATNLIELII